VVAVTFSPDGFTLATASDDGTARLWTTATGQPVATLAGHTDAVSAVAFRPDGHTLATASEHRTVLLWESPFIGDPYTALCSRIGRSVSEQEWEVIVPDLLFEPVC
jgi:WD40 repeat protein